AAAGFQPGEIDGEFGPRTASAVSSLQNMRHLPVTGIADADTLRSLGLAVPELAGPIFPTIPITPITPTIPTIPITPAGVAAGGGASMQQQDILKPVLEVLAARPQPPATSATPAATGVDTSQLLKIVLGTLTGKADATSATGTTPPVMSPIDKLLGGEALQG